MPSETLQITTADGVADAYVSRPGDGEHPGVLLYGDAFGLRPRIEEMADRMASWGFVVLAPNLFYRHGTAPELAPALDLTDPANREASFAVAMPRVNAHTPQQAHTDLAAYVETLQGLSGGSALGVTGYCMGGRLALRAAAARPDVFVAAALFHAGGLVTDADDSPHRVASSARAEVFAGHADHDRSNTPEQIATLEAALGAAGLTYTSEVFEGAPHGYTMSDTSSYDEEAAERHFRELEALLHRKLKG